MFNLLDFLKFLSYSLFPDFYFFTISTMLIWCSVSDHLTDLMLLPTVSASTHDALFSCVCVGVEGEAECVYVCFYAPRMSV